MRFQKRWQRQTLPQMFHILISRKPRAIGRNLEEHAAWLMEVDRMEVEAVNDRRNATSPSGDLFVPLRLLLVIGSAECYVMYASDTWTTTWHIGAHIQMNFSPRTT